MTVEFHLFVGILPNLDHNICSRSSKRNALESAVHRSDHRFLRLDRNGPSLALKEMNEEKQYE